jgi:hypothetical protein
LPFPNQPNENAIEISSGLGKIVYNSSSMAP